MFQKKPLAPVLVYMKKGNQYWCALNSQGTTAALATRAYKESSPSRSPVDTKIYDNIDSGFFTRQITQTTS
jgi:hypothetical protein